FRDLIARFLGAQNLAQIRTICESDAIVAEENKSYLFCAAALRNFENLAPAGSLRGAGLAGQRGDFLLIESSLRDREECGILVGFLKRHSEAVEIALVVEASLVQKFRVILIGLRRWRPGVEFHVPGSAPQARDSRMSRRSTMQESYREPARELLRRIESYEESYGQETALRSPENLC